MAINPRYEIPHLYTKEIACQYRNKEGKCSSHVFAMGKTLYIRNSCKFYKDFRFFSAQEAINNIHTSKASQSFIISGETGAGKTETAKHILNYLVEVEETDSNQIKHRLINPITEYFGNAQTVNNDNSSRFNKYTKVYMIFPFFEYLYTFNSIMLIFLVFILSHVHFGFLTQLLFDHNMKIVGGEISYHLLETNRVSSQDPYEANFHIFYTLLEAPHELKQTLHINQTSYSVCEN